MASTTCAPRTSASTSSGSGLRSARATSSRKRSRTFGCAALQLRSIAQPSNTTPSARSRFAAETSSKFTSGGSTESSTTLRTPAGCLRNSVSATRVPYDSPCRFHFSISEELAEIFEIVGVGRGRVAVEVHSGSDERFPALRCRGDQRRAGRSSRGDLAFDAIDLRTLERRLGVSRSALLEDDEVAIVEKRDLFSRAAPRDAAVARTAGDEDEWIGSGARAAAAENHHRQANGARVVLVAVLRNEQRAAFDALVRRDLGRTRRALETRKSV